METRNRLALTVCVALAGAWLSMPSSAQGLAAQSARINALGDAGKYAEAIPLAQAMLANLEKSPASRDYAGALNNLAELYRGVGRDADAEPLYKRAIAIMEKAVGLNSVDIAPELNNLAALYQRQGRHAEAEPLFKRALALSEKSLPPVIPTSDEPSTIWPRTTKNRTATPIPSRCSGARLPSTRRRQARTVPRSRRF